MLNEEVAVGAECGVDNSERACDGCVAVGGGSLLRPSLERSS